MGGERGEVEGNRLKRKQLLRGEGAAPVPTLSYLLNRSVRNWYAD